MSGLLSGRRPDPDSQEGLWEVICRAATEVTVGDVFGLACLFVILIWASSFSLIFDTSADPAACRSALVTAEAR